MSLVAASSGSNGRTRQGADAQCSSSADGLKMFPSINGRSRGTLGDSGPWWTGIERARADCSGLEQRESGLESVGAYALASLNGIRGN